MLDVFPTIKAHSTKFKRTDIVFDVYLPSSLKAENKMTEMRCRMTRDVCQIATETGIN